MPRIAADTNVSSISCCIASYRANGSSSFADKPARSLARQPLFQVVLAFQNGESATVELAGLQAEFTKLDTGTAKFDLSLTFRSRHEPEGTPGGISVALEYAADLFDHGTVEALAGRLVRLLDQVAADPGLRVSGVDDTIRKPFARASVA